MSRILISFIGSHDLTPNKNGAVEQLITKIKPSYIYLFLTENYVEKFNENGLGEHYQNFSESDLEVVKTEIANPVDFEEIAQKTAEKIQAINDFASEHKHQIFINLTSGTPAIISVLSLYAITGQLNNTIGVYAPNPQFDTQIKLNSLDYYKNSFAYKTLKDMININDYNGVLEFLKRNKILPKLNTNEQFKTLIAFAQNRINCNFTEAQEIYDKHSENFDFEYIAPQDLYEKSVECLMCAKSAKKNTNIFQATLQLGIIRENILTYLMNTLLERAGLDIIHTETIDKRDHIEYFSSDVEEKCPELVEYMQENLNKSNVLNKSLDLKIRINSFMSFQVVKFMSERIEDNRNLELIIKELNKLDSLKGVRNKLAHTIEQPKLNDGWFVSIEKILILIAEEFGYSAPDFNQYEQINRTLLTTLKQALN